MATVVWPTSLPQAPFIRYTLRQAANVIKSDMGSGPPKKRRRSTLVRKFLRSGMELTGTQMATFDAFMINIKDGADKFEWVDPRDGVTVKNFTFINGAPDFTNVTPADAPTLRRFEGLLDLEEVA